MVQDQRTSSWFFPSVLWRQRELLWQFTLRNVELRHKGSHLGLFWSFLNPLLMLALYVFVFGFIFGGSFGVKPGESKMDYALAVFLGLSVFHLFAETLAVAPSVVVSQPNFVKKVVFPLEILPAATVGASLFHFLITLCLIGLGLLFTGTYPGSGVLILPIIMAPLALFCLGIAWFFSAIGVFFRDIGQLTGFVTMTLMFASAVFYPSTQIPPGAWAILKFNPVLQAVELMRDALLWERPVPLFPLVLLWATGSISSLLGFLVFRKLKPAFADVI